jgi:hypothetical protein
LVCSVERLFAVIIILGVAITIAIAGAVWIKTTIESMRWRPELLKILDATMYYNQSDNSWYVNLTVENNGEGVAEIYKLEVQGIEKLEFDTPLVVRQGERRTLTVRLEKKYNYGTRYLLRLYLKSGSAYPVLGHVVQV